MTTRSVCFTIFEEDWDRSCLEDERVKCAAVQLETCPETCKDHYQGFAMFFKPMRYAAIKELLKCDSAHLEKTRGTPLQAWEYCTKEESRKDGPWTYGDKPKGSGHR